MRGMLLGVALALATPVPAPAAAPAPKPCRVIADPAGDVVTFGPAPTQHVDDGHIDLRAVDVAQTRGALLVTFRGAAISKWRLGVWRAAFTARGKRLYVVASLGQWNAYGGRHATPGFWAGYAGIPEDVKVTGAYEFEASAITVTVPLAAFGPAAPRARDRLTSFAVEVREELLYIAPDGKTAAAEVGLTDRGGSASSLVIRGECRAR